MTLVDGNYYERWQGFDRYRFSLAKVAQWIT
jgi:hypothetical protein